MKFIGLDCAGEVGALKVTVGKPVEISTALPCRISICEEGGKTKIATMFPTQVLGLFEAEGLDAVAESVERDLVAMIDAALAAG